MKINAMSDHELVRIFSEGNNDAFDVLLDRYKDNVFTYIMLMVHNRDKADDIFQETFIKAIMTIKNGKYVEKGKFISWVKRIAHNLIIDSYRKDQSENTISNDEYEDVDLFNQSKLCDGNIEDDMIRTQVYSDVRDVVSCLSDVQREVVRLRYYEDLSFKEIADKTGVSINTALGRMRYAIMNIRRLSKENNKSLVY